MILLAIITAGVSSSDDESYSLSEDGSSYTYSEPGDRHGSGVPPSVSSEGSTDSDEVRQQNADAARDALNQQFPAPAASFLLPPTAYATLNQQTLVRLSEPATVDSIEDRQLCQQFDRAARTLGDGWCNDACRFFGTLHTQRPTIFPHSASPPPVFPDAHEQRGGLTQQPSSVDIRMSNARLSRAVTGLYNNLQHRSRFGGDRELFNEIPHANISGNFRAEWIVYFAAFLCDPTLYNFWRLLELLEQVRGVVLYYNLNDHGGQTHPDPQHPRDEIDDDSE